MADSFQTSNGPRTTAQMEQELRNAGWAGPPAGTEGAGSVANAYAQTTGGPVTPMQAQAGGPPAGAGNTSVYNPSAPSTPATTNQQGANLNAAQLLLNQAQQAAYQAYLNARLNLDTDQLAFNKATQAFNNTITEANLTGSYQGSQTLAGQKQAADIAAQTAGITGYYTAPGQASMADAPGQLQSMRDKAASLKAAADAATAALSANPNDLSTRQAATAAVDAYTAAQNDWVARSPALMAAGSTGAQGTPTLARQQFEASTATDYLKLISGLRGPSDYVQYLKVLGSTPGGLRDLVGAAAGQYRPATGASTGVATTPASLGGLIGDATSGGAGGTTYGQYMQQTAGLPLPNQISSAAYNAFTDSQKQLLLGAYEAQGWNPADVADLYKQSLPRYAGPAGTGVVKL